MDELQRFWSACSSLEGAWADFFRLLILTGARRSPFCAMQWRHLDLDAGVWLIPVEWAKSKREMALPLSSEAVRILRERLTRAMGVAVAGERQRPRRQPGETLPALAQGSGGA
jgi:integrase